MQIIDLYIQGCADAAMDPITTLCIFLQKPKDYPWEDTPPVVAEYLLVLTDWDEESSLLAHEVARLIRSIERRRITKTIQEALWPD